MKTVPLKFVLTPWLLSLAVSQAYAVDITRTGTDGVRGADGPTVEEPGTAGTVGGAARRRIATGDASNRLVLTGGRGGDGGDAGYDRDNPRDGGRGGAGGDGGRAQGRLVAVRAAGAVAVEVITVGGGGGMGGDNGCCSSLTGHASGGAGGVASSLASAATGEGKAHVVAAATGGNAGLRSDGGAAFATGIAVAANGVASGQVLAVGGQGGGDEWPGGPNRKQTGDATARLSVTGNDLVSGDATATGGKADASLVLRGAGATGTSLASGGYASSSARANTTGRSVVDLTALAQVVTNGSSAAEVFVDSGYSTAAAAAGNASITGKALAGNAEFAFGLNTARITLLGSGNIVGTSESRGADSAISYEGSYSGYQRLGGAAQSYASASTRGNGDVTLTARALGGNTLTNELAQQPGGGAATAVASGESGSGRVNVKAEVRSSSEKGFDLDNPFANPTVHASAKTTVAGGSTTAEARHQSTGSGDYGALAEASSVGSGGARAVASAALDNGVGGGGTVESRASASGAGVEVSTVNQLHLFSGGATATSAANMGGGLSALPSQQDGAALASTAIGLPSSAAVSALLGDRPAFAATEARWLGAGAMGFYNDGLVGSAQSVASYSFASIAGQHLMLGLLGAPQNLGAIGLSFSVSNHGVLLFTSEFYAMNYNALFADQLLDLGDLGGGPQSLSISTSWHGSGNDPSAYSFQYLVGVTPVPESSTWLAMLLGLGTLVMVARRRRV